MSGIIFGAGLALSALVMYILLDAMGYRGARLLTVTATVMLFVLAISAVPELISSVQIISESTGIGDTVGCAMRILGIGYVSGISYDVALDMGSKGLASAVMMLGRVEMLLVITPYVTEVVKLAVELI